MRTPASHLMLELVSEKTVLDVVHEMSSKLESEDPFYVVDLSDVVLKHKLWKIKLPRVEPFYNVKCCDDPVLLELLAALGTGFQCTNKAEIESVLSLGVSSSRIVYANPCKTKSVIKHAASAGVELMTFDNEMELRKIHALFPNARLVLLIRTEDSAESNQGFQFGCKTSDAPRLLKTAKDLGLNVVGLSIHVESNCYEYSMYSKAILSSRQIFDVAASLGFKMTILGIGSGFTSVKNKVDLEKVLNIVNEALDACFPPGNFCELTITAEPGRFYLDSAFTLCTNVIAKRIVAAQNGESDRVIYYINDGVYGSFSSLLFDPTDLVPIPLTSTDGSPKLPSSIWGPTCDSLDCIVESCNFPRMDVGDWLLFENMGGRMMVASSTLSGCPKPVIKFILHSHTLTYLRQLPSMPKWMEKIDGEDWSSVEGADESLSALLSLACC